MHPKRFVHLIDKVHRLGVFKGFEIHPFIKYTHCFFVYFLRKDTIKITIKRIIRERKNLLLFQFSTSAISVYQRGQISD